MKTKMLIPIILTILLSFVIQSIAVCPSPFDKAKDMALKVQMDSVGRYILGMAITKNGDDTIYVIGYIPHLGIIGIGKVQGIKYVIYEYNERTCGYTVSRNNLREPIDPTLCIREAFLIFREMVMEKVI